MSADRTTRRVSEPQPPTWISAAALPDSVHTIALIGTDDGAAVDLLTARYPHARVLVLEPEASGTPSTSDQWASVTVLAGPDYGSASQIARSFPELHTAAVLVSPRLEREDPAAVAAAREALRRLMFQSSANAQAKRSSEGRYLLQTLANGPRLARGASAGALRGLATGMPAVIVAAGPSLDQNVRDLATIGDRALVIACDTAARPLLNLLVDVDFIVAADPTRANAAHLSSLPPTPAWLVAEASVHPSALVHGDGRTFFFRVADHQPWPWLRSLDLDVDVLETWGSVATSAFSLALELGCNPIVFLGADFAFTGGRPYCRGTTFESLYGLWMGGGVSEEAIWQMLVDRWPVEHQPGLDGQLQRTAPHLVAFRDWIVERSRRAEGRRIINATGAGLLTGADIVQQTACAALASMPPIDRPRFHDAVRSARRADPSRLMRWLLAVTDVVQRRDAAGPAAGLWSCASVSPEAVTAALRSPEFTGWTLAHDVIQSVLREAS